MRELSLHITDACNFQCGFCVWGETLLRSGDRVPWSDLERFLRANRDQGFERVNLHGGEPTMRSDLFRLLALVRDLGYPSVSVQTNGWTLANPRFVERLVAAGVGLFVISVHGHSAATHDRLSGAPGSLERLLRGMKAIRSLGQAIRTNTVVTSVNYRYLTHIVWLVVGAGASHVNISALMPSGRALPFSDALMPSYLEAAPYACRAAREAEDLGAETSLEGFPWCVVRGLEDRCLRRDLAQGDQVKCLIRGVVWDNHDAFVEEYAKSKGAGCRLCQHQQRCPGVYTAYVRSRGWAEFTPVPPAATTAREATSHAQG